MLTGFSPSIIMSEVVLEEGAKAEKSIEFEPQKAQKHSQKPVIFGNVKKTNFCKLDWLECWF